MNNQTSMCSNQTCMWLGANGKSIGLLLIRLFVGVLFLIMGYHKLFGGIPMVTGMIAGMGFPAANFFAYVVALTEFLGGIALILGVAVRPFAALLTIIMITAFFGIHGHSIEQGMAPFVLIGVCAGLTMAGSGRLSLWHHCCLNGRDCKCGMNGEKGGCGCCQAEGMGKKK